MTKLTTIAFDADDTLWQNEQFFRLTQDRFAELLADYVERDHLHARLLEAERRNLGHYGFGIKGFVLSMIETALDVTERRVPGAVIAELLEAGQEMLRHPIHLMPEAAETIATLSGRYRLLVITKGDLLDQERKLAQSGLGDLFDAVEIVSDKTPDTYTRAFATDPHGPAGAMMVGNSLKSDVIPAIAAGAYGVHVPHDLTWELEHAAPPVESQRFHEVPDLGALLPLIDRLIA
ncbi:HAD family hydrolase [Dinoroseobacter sp. S76]|uniref:HAD family hydrolase n=1 Tax=Dinoroseobacter sp. S76 TaxID=3415124 RepID=UPI003C7DC9FE